MSHYNRFHFNFILPLVEFREKRNSRKYYKALKDSEHMSHEELTSLQFKRIKEMLAYAYTHTVFYRNKFDELNLKPDDIKSYEDFGRLPLITREDLNNHLEMMKSDAMADTQRYVTSTGGSTGLATKFVQDYECFNKKRASEYRFNTWAGWEPGAKILYYWPALQDFSGNNSKFTMARSKFYTRALQLFAGKLNPAILSEHLSSYEDFRPDLIRTFPSALQRLAEYIVNSKKNLNYFPQAIISVGEPLQLFQRELFQDVFKCEVYNCYVSRECGNIACECKAHNGLHIADEQVYLEIVNANTEGYGEIVLTDLCNFGMPLIRYRIQDAGKLLSGPCACGKNHRRIGVDAARLSDYLISPADGSYISGPTLIHYILAEGPGNGRIKLIQDQKDHIEVVLTGSESENEKVINHIQTKMDTIFKGKMRLSYKFVDSIPLLASGKYSFVERKYK